jgi:hypothetical protein
MQGAGKFHCSMMSIAYMYIRTPLFILENMFDSNQVEDEVSADSRRLETLSALSRKSKMSRGCQEFQPVLAQTPCIRSASTACDFAPFFNLPQSS